MQNIEIELKTQPAQSSPIPSNIFHPGRTLLRQNKPAPHGESSQPISSSTITEYRRTQTKQQAIELRSKLQMIKLKCMRKNQKESSKTSKLIRGDSVQGQAESEDQTTDTAKRQVGRVKLIRSPFPNRPPTVFFSYPPNCNIQPLPHSTRIYEPIHQPILTYRLTGWQYNCIINTLQSNGFSRAEDNEWNVFFDINANHTKVIEGMNRFQKISHFPGCWNLGLKDFMWRWLNKQKRSHPEQYDFVPTTYLFPGDFERFQFVRETSDKSKLWIMKPTNQACGRGIKMLTKQTKLKNKKDVLVSEYISNPHLINNFKYDLRIYVVVTSYDPLRIYMYREGLTRFATCEYTCRIKDVKKRFMHLTNFSVNKHSKNFIKNSKTEKDGQGSKWSLSALRKYYTSQNIDTAKLFADIQAVIIKTCISAEPVMLDIHSKSQEKRNCSFQLYGFDILIDAALKPWLMEVNVCPSLSSSSPMDKKIKNALITDMLNLSGVYPYSRKNLEINKKRERNLHQPSKKLFAKNINALNELNYYNCVELLSPQDWLMLFESEEEMQRLGNFDRIFPNKANVDEFRDLFEINRYNNNVLWQHIKSQKGFLGRLMQ